MPLLHDDVDDQALQYLEDNGNRLDICSQEPADYAEATSTYSLGNKTGISWTGPAAGDTSGRKTTVDAITDGDVTASGTASHWAVVDTENEKLLATEELASPKGVTYGNVFTLEAIDVEIQDPTEE